MTGKMHPTQVSMLTPLEVPMGVDVLIAVLEDVLDNIQRNRRPDEETEDTRMETELLIAQREQFLAWLQHQPGPNVPIALYPAEQQPEIMVQPYGSGPVLYS